jgi:hypothetical protein
MPLPAWAPQAASIGSTLLGLKKGGQAGGTASAAGQEAAQRLTDAWTGAEEIYREHFDRALEALEAGDEEFAARILEGIGLSNEEIDKAIDLSLDALEWVVDFGKAGVSDYEGLMKEAGDYMAYHKQLVFDPDAIYGTKAYQSIKKRTEQEWDNYYSGKGMLGGNASEALADRMFQLGTGFRQQELTNALAGAQASQGLAGTRLAQIGMGADATRLGAQNIFGGGLQKAANIMGGHGAIASAGLQLNQAPYLMQGGQFLTEGAYGSALGQSASQSRLGNALITGGLGIAGATDWGNVLGRQPTTSSSGGFLPAWGGTNPYTTQPFVPNTPQYGNFWNLNFPGGGYI